MAEKTGRQEQQPFQQGEQGLDTKQNQAHGQREQPEERRKHQPHYGKRPAEHQQNTPTDEENKQLHTNNSERTSTTSSANMMHPGAAQGQQILSVVARAPGRPAGGRFSSRRPAKLPKNSLGPPPGWFGGGLTASLKKHVAQARSGD